MINSLTLTHNRKTPTTATKLYYMNESCMNNVNHPNFSCTPVSGAYVVQNMKKACDENDEDDSDLHPTEGD